MKILNIRSFREFFKSNIRITQDQNRNPHFAGHSRQIENSTQFGFFDLYHGIKPNMENLLKTILEMARDSQALYEFMQNAVDAKSTDFLLFHHRHDPTNQDYLVVVNNGQAFDLRGVLAILNIGASNKYRDANSIGQFGVGFKLAHRLVGEETGLKALLEENKGPILFSWQKGELEQLAKDESYEVTEPRLEGYEDKATCLSDEPWLMKILYTNFPCLPNDDIIDAQDRATTGAFNADEQEILKIVAKRSLDAIQGKSYDTGSLLLIPLHPNKIKELTEDSHKYGLEISMSILNQRSGSSHKNLERIVLNGHELEQIDSHVELFREDALKMTHEEEGINKPIFENINILEIDFLYNDPFSEVNYFKGKPQFYLYFPMTEERHGFRFAVHCNAFSFTSARTALQENTLRNKTIFKLLTTDLRHKLSGYAFRDKPRFEMIYASLLLSQKGDNGEWKENREWLEEDLWEPLMELLVDFMPINNGMGSWALPAGENQIYIKDSGLPIEDWQKNQRAWFFWNSSTQQQLFEPAIDKLKITPFGLIDTLKDTTSIPLINEWLTESAENADQFLMELNSLTDKLALLSKEEQAQIWDNIAMLKLWTFSDERYTIETLSDEADLWDKLISYGPLESIEELLVRAGFTLSKEKLNKFSAIEIQLRQRYQAKLSYLNRFEALHELLSRGFCQADLYTPDEKTTIFTTLLKAVSESVSTVVERIQRMKVLALFSNDWGEVKPLKNLIQRNELPLALKGWHIKMIELKSLDLSDYTSGTEEEIYENILIPSWHDISTSASSLTETDRVTLFETVKEYHNTKPAMQSIPPDRIFFSKDGILNEDETSFYHPYLKEYKAEYYSSLEEACKKSGIGTLPQYSLLTYYESQPFTFPANTELPLEITDNGIFLNANEAFSLIRLFLKIDAEKLQVLLFSDVGNNSIKLYNKTEGIDQCFTIEESLLTYIKKWNSRNLILLPPPLKSIGDHVVLKGELLITHIIKNISYLDAIADLIELIRKLGNESHKEEFLSILGEGTPFKIEKELTEDHVLSDIVKLCISVEDTDKRAKLLSRLISVAINGEQQRLSEISNHGSDELIISTETEIFIFSIARILGGENNTVNQLLTSVANRWASLNLGSVQDIEEALGVKARKNADDVLNDLLDQLADGVIENGDQLAFIMLQAKGDTAILEDLNVSTLDNTQPLMDNIYYFNSHGLEDFIDDNMLLTDSYNTCIGLLNLTNNHVFDADETLLIDKPYLLADKLILPGIYEMDNPKSQAAFFNYLYKLWLNLNKPPTIFHPEEADGWVPLLGFNPLIWILAEEWAVDEEIIPYEKFLQYEQDKEILSKFFSAVGAQGIHSPVIQWRKWFVAKGSQPNENIQGQRAVRTLKWLAAQNVIVQGDQLVNIYNSLENEVIGDLPLPAYVNGELRILISDVERMIFVTSQQEDKARDMKITLSEISTLDLVIIPPLNALKLLSPKIELFYKPLIIGWKNTDWIKLNQSAVEWSLPFYQPWSEKYKLHIYAYKGQVPRQLLVNDSIFREFDEGDFIIDKDDANKIYVNEYLIPSVIIEKIESEDIFTPEAISALRTAYQASTEKYSALFEKIQSDKNLAIEINNLLHKVEQQQNKKDAAQRLNDPLSRYTEQWFEDLIDLVRIQENINALPPIEFSGIRLLPETSEIYELSKPSGRVSADIESYDSISAVITYKGESGQLSILTTRVEVTRKNQTVWVRFPEAMAKEVLKEREIRTVKLTFGRVADLIQMLKSGFRSLNLLPETNLKATLTHNIKFLFGPPGTGKTTTLATRLYKRIEDGIEGPIIVLTPTNKAADVLAHKIITINGGIPPAWLVRFGTCTDPKLLAENVVTNRSNTIVNEHTPIVLITTIHRFTYDSVRRNTRFAEETMLYNCPWTLVVFDEASMIPLPYITFSIHKRTQVNPKTQFWVAGDPLQIPPVFDLISEDLDNIDELQKENIYTMVGLSSFDEDEQRSIPVYGENKKIENLSIQHRSIPVIGDLFSKFQYEGKIEHSRGTPSNDKSDISRPLPEFFRALGLKPITVIRYQVNDNDTLYKPTRLNNSPLHLQSALLVNEFVKRFNIEIEKEKQEKWTIGIISPYRAQATLIDKMIEDTIPYSERLEVNINTVHGFQGDENQLVIAVLNPGNVNAAYSRFLNEAHIINVAISRAEDYLILFIPDKDTRGLNDLPLIHENHQDSLLDIIGKLPKEFHVEISASTIEKELMDDAHYFENHSRTTTHLPVNVYGKCETPYLFRMSGNAVDVHWQGSE